MIRPFGFSDTFLIQRLANQATKLNAEQALLQPRSTVWTALTAVIPWKDARASTYILSQKGHRLASAGFIQARKRSLRPEADILLLAPALDTPFGHPAIWEKLLSFYIQEAAQQKIARVYVDVPDQPLPVGSFTHVGFQVYARQTIWRLHDYGTQDRPASSSDVIRPQVSGDDWALQKLYAQITPKTVQRAHGVGANSQVAVPILYCSLPGACQRFVLEEDGEITGCLQIMYSKQGTWWTIWTDPLQPDAERIRLLLRCGLRVARSKHLRYPIYIGVNDYHGALGAILTEYGFAPFTDRALMVKHLVQWVKQAVPASNPALEGVGEIVSAPFILPEKTRQSAGSGQRLSVEMPTKESAA